MRAFRSKPSRDISALSPYNPQKRLRDRYEAHSAKKRSRPYRRFIVLGMVYDLSLFSKPFRPRVRDVGRFASWGSLLRVTISFLSPSKVFQVSCLTFVSFSSSRHSHSLSEKEGFGATGPSPTPFDGALSRG